MKKSFELPNYRVFKVSFISPTNAKGARVKIKETQRYNDQKTKSVTLSYDYSVGDVQEQAYRYLTEKGFNVICRGSEINNYYLMANNWGENYLEL